MSASDFTERAVEPAAARLALADLLLPDSRAAYQALIAEKLHVTEAHEGLALLALKAGDKDAARREFAAAIAAGSAGARCYLEYGRLEPDTAKALDALRHAVKLNPKLAEAHFLIARRETDPARRLAALKSAADAEPARRRAGGRRSPRSTWRRRISPAPRRRGPPPSRPPPTTPRAPAF